MINIASTSFSVISCVEKFHYSVVACTIEIISIIQENKQIEETLSHVSELLHRLILNSSWDSLSKFLLLHLYVDNARDKG